jgi:hypothetical protein
MYAQMGGDPLIIKVGGEPNPILEIGRGELMESLDTQWRFRGPNKAINRDMQVQQLMMWVKTFGEGLTPAEFRFAARLILDLLDIRGASKLVTSEGTATKVQEYQAAAAAAQMQQGVATKAAATANVDVPPEAAATMASNEGGGR